MKGMRKYILVKIVFTVSFYPLKYINSSINCLTIDNQSFNISTWLNIEG